MKPFETAFVDILIALWSEHGNTVSSKEIHDRLTALAYTHNGAGMLVIFHQLSEDDLVNGIVFEDPERRRIHGDFVLTSVSDVLTNETM